MEQHVQVRVAGLIRKQNQVLVMFYDYPNGRIHAIPGGRMEQGEFAPQALKREYQEELGLDIEVGSLLFVGEMAQREKMKQTIHLIFEATILAGEPQLNPAETSAQGVGWLELRSVGDHHLYPDIAAAISDLDELPPTARYLGNVMSRKWM